MNETRTFEPVVFTHAEAIAFIRMTIEFGADDTLESIVDILNATEPDPV